MTSAASPSSGRWLYGPARDLLIGCGLWYALAFLAFSFAGEQIRLGGAMALLPFIILVFSTPHYGATLLRVYERREDRRAYTFFAVWATAFLLMCFAVGVHSAIVGSWIVTIYLTWSPWHYTGQNYGIAVMFLRRRGAELTPVVKRFVYASFSLSYLLTFLALHSGARASHYAPFTYDTPNYRFLSLGLPAGFTEIAFAVVATAYLVALGGAGVLLLRRSRPRDLAPAAALALTQALWFSIPIALRYWRVDPYVEPWTSDYGTYYFLWIAVGHAVQYLWVTSYYARARGGWSGHGAYLSKVMLAGAAVWVLPALLFAPGALGRLPFDAGLSILVASLVNIHHFILDGAIWKLRDGRVARILVRSATEAAGTPTPERPARRWIGPVIWATGLLCVAVIVLGKWEREIGVRHAARAGDVERVRTAVERLERLGRDSPDLRLALGKTLARRGDPNAALLEYRRAIDLYPNAAAWLAVGKLFAQQERWRQAADAYERAVALRPEGALGHYELGVARLALHRPAAARDAFARAAELDPGRKIHRVMLERAERALADAPE